MAKSNIFGNSKRFLSKLLPGRWRFGLLQWTVIHRFKAPPLVFPWNCSTMKKVLAILPEEPVEAFHQISNYIRISGLFHDASFVVFCTREVRPYFQQVHPQAAFIEYERRQRFLFSKEFDEWGKELHDEEFDLCLMLERSPDASLLYLAGKTAAAVRAGYCGAGEFPFLNLQVNPSSKQPYLADQNALMANVFGAPKAVPIGWSVSKETIDELSHMARELSISPAARLVGVDAEFLFNAFGAEWTRRLFDAFSKSGDDVFCSLIDGEPSEELSEFLTSLNIPVFSNLSASRLAAILTRCVCTVSGRSVLFELANLLCKPVVGIFEKDSCSRYCRQSASTRGITYTAQPDHATIQSIADAVHTITGAGKR
jgi:ADP-heptose:LPS heptosyltransferase